VSYNVQESDEQHAALGSLVHPFPHYNRIYICGPQQFSKTVNLYSPRQSEGLSDSANFTYINNNYLCDWIEHCGIYPYRNQQTHQNYHFIVMSSQTLQHVSA
jgi:hypothetical protein